MRTVYVGPSVYVNNGNQERKLSAKPTQHSDAWPRQKCVWGLFSLMAMAPPTYRCPPPNEYQPDLTEQAMNRYHEVNELYDGTLNSVHHYMYATDIAANDSFTFRNTMKQ